VKTQSQNLILIQSQMLNLKQNPIQNPIQNLSLILILMQLHHPRLQQNL
jgi:hypothetical protein